MNLKNVRRAGTPSWLGWDEYEYDRDGHEHGYFRQKGDIRLFYRLAGEYYSDGTEYKPIDRPKTISQMHDAGMPGLSYHLREEWGGRDAPVALDFVGAARENGKRRWFPTQIRFYRGNELLCFIVEWEGKKVADFEDDKDFEPIMEWASVTLVDAGKEVRGR